MNLLAPSVYSRYTKEVLNDIFKELDLVIVDLDECIFPGITKVTMYRNVCLLLIQHRRVKDCLLLGRLLAGSVMMALMKLAQVFCPWITNRQLILRFAKIIKPVPLPYLRKAAAAIPSRSYAGARETLELLSEKARVGIISHGLDIVLNEYAEQFNSDERTVIDFWDGNILSELTDRQDNTDNSFIFDQRDKQIRAERRIFQFGSKKMMVIGHNRDDLGMIKAAREHGGIIVGFNPTSEIEKWCDIVINGKNWIGFRQVIQELD